MNTWRPHLSSPIRQQLHWSSMWLPRLSFPLQSSAPVIECVFSSSARVQDILSCRYLCSTCFCEWMRGSSTRSYLCDTCSRDRVSCSCCNQTVRLWSCRPQSRTKRWIVQIRDGTFLDPELGSHRAAALGLSEFVSLPVLDIRRVYYYGDVSSKSDSYPFA